MNKPSDAATILVVEDEAHIRRMVLTMLQRFGYGAVAAADGYEALALARTLGSSMRLLFTDVTLPGLDGRQLALQLREEAPDLRVLFASGYAADSVEEQLDQPGTRFLQKPYNPSQLRELLHELLAS